jgi:TonB family protein
MSNFFSKCLGEIALMATAVLWTGCGNVDKDSKNEKSLNASNSFGVAEVSNLKDSLNTNSPTVVLVDSVKRLDSVLANLINIRTNVCYYGVIARPRRSFEKDGLLGALSNVPRLRGSVKVLYEKIKSANKRTPNQDTFSRVERVFRLRAPSLKHIYCKYLKKNSDNTFEGVITLKLTIAADGTVKESSIKKSTTGVKEFDENIRTVVNRWTFSKVNSGTTVVYVPIRFYEEDKTSSQPK